MDKRFEKYFGNNIMRTVYLAGVALIAIGLAVAIFYWAGYGTPIAMVGVALFFISSAKQVSDKQVDEYVQKTADEYAKEKIDGRTVGKQTLDARNFSVFRGYVRETKNARFKAGRDSKIRTSNFFVTAMSIEKNDYKIFTTVYDMLSDEKPTDKMICTKGADSVELKSEKIELPRGIVKYELTVVRGEESESFVFYLPDDALADKLIAKIR